MRYTCVVQQNRIKGDGWKDCAYVTELLKKEVVAENWVRELRRGSQLWCVPTRDRGPGDISSEDFPS